MAFDILKNKKLSNDGIEEIDPDSNEAMLQKVERASKSNVIATQSWVSSVLRGFCAWTRVFHTNVLHALCEVVTPKLKSKEAHIDEVCAKSLVLANEDGVKVRITVGKDGKLDVQEATWDVFLYPLDCFVREYFYLDDDVVGNFAGMGPFQTLLNFSTFKGKKSCDFKGRRC